MLVLSAGCRLFGNVVTALHHAEDFFSPGSTLTLRRGRARTRRANADAAAMGFLEFPRNVFNAAIDVPVHFVTHFTDDLVERTRARPHPPRNFPERYYGTHAPGEIPHP